MFQVVVALFSTCAGMKHKSQRGGQEKQSVTSPQGASLGLSNVDLKYSAQSEKYMATAYCVCCAAIKEGSVTWGRNISPSLHSFIFLPLVVNNSLRRQWKFLQCLIQLQEKQGSSERLEYDTCVCWMRTKGLKSSHQRGRKQQTLDTNR